MYEDSDSPTTLKVTTTSKFKDALSTAVNNALDKWLTEENLENFIDFVGVLSK